jgi:uncharacterized protein (DUF4415 family)
MAKRKKPDHIAQKDWNDVDSPPLTDKQLVNMKPVRDAFPDLAEYAAKRKRGQRGPQKAPRKVPMSMRVDPDLLARYQSTGAGWQTRMHQALQRGLKDLSK